MLFLPRAWKYYGWCCFICSHHHPRPIIALSCNDVLVRPKPGIMLYFGTAGFTPPAIIGGVFIICVLRWLRLGDPIFPGGGSIIIPRLCGVPIVPKCAGIFANIWFGSCKGTCGGINGGGFISPGWLRPVRGCSPGFGPRLFLRCCLGE